MREKVGKQREIIRIRSQGPGGPLKKMGKLRNDEPPKKENFGLKKTNSKRKGALKIFGVHPNFLRRLESPPNLGKGP